MQMCSFSYPHGHELTKNFSLSRILTAVGKRACSACSTKTLTQDLIRHLVSVACKVRDWVLMGDPVNHITITLLSHKFSKGPKTLAGYEAENEEFSSVDALLEYLTLHPQTTGPWFIMRLTPLIPGSSE